MRYQKVTILIFFFSLLSGVNNSIMICTKYFTTSWLIDVVQIMSNSSDYVLCYENFLTENEFLTLQNLSSLYEHIK